MTAGFVAAALVIGACVGYLVRGFTEERATYNRGFDEGMALAAKQEEQRRSRAGLKAAFTRRARAAAEGSNGTFSVAQVAPFEMRHDADADQEMARALRKDPPDAA